MRPEKTHKNSDSGIRFKTSADDAISHMVLSFVHYFKRLNVQNCDSII